MSLFVRKSWPFRFQYIFNIYSDCFQDSDSWWWRGDVQFAFLRRHIFEGDQFKLKKHSYKNFALTQKCDQLKENKSGFNRILRRRQNSTDLNCFGSQRCWCSFKSSSGNDNQDTSHDSFWYFVGQSFSFYTFVWFFFMEKSKHFLLNSLGWFWG